jgi:hypothetical protein
MAADRAGSVKLSLLTAVTTLVFGYVSFLLVSYVIYAFLYSRMSVDDDADFVVVLRSGLKDGSQVTPLLAVRPAAIISHRAETASCCHHGHCPFYRECLNSTLKVARQECSRCVLRSELAASVIWLAVSGVSRVARFGVV